ncbi:hypothetical protein H0O02_00440 [Candidatus Micrarchaeota archaeon]|nr:hypothetical protein [Candidatus Micrarchaeota archaeon]
MKIFKTIYKLPTGTVARLALAALGLSAFASLEYDVCMRKMEHEIKYGRAAVVNTQYRPNIVWDNFVHEGGGTAGDWSLFLEQLEKINGGDMTSFRSNDTIRLLDMPDPKTGKPDGKVLPENYPR